MSRKLLCIAIVPLLAAAVYCLRPEADVRAAGAMPQSAYVWQRAWTEAVGTAVAEHGTNFAELIALNAEVSWKNRSPQIVRVPIDPRPLQQMGRPIGLALRIGAYSGPFKTDDAQAFVLTELAASLIAQAASNCLSVAELQLDFDCAESKLDAYTTWVRAIQSKVKPVPVTITALPAWLKRSAFGRLIAAADGYVLQVHSLARPKSTETLFKLCDPSEARRAVDRAAQWGKPFRVALPTYAYVMAFGPNGQFVGLSAEAPALAWPEGTQLREIRADPEAMAEMLQAWNTDRPKALTGVIWYRLPVAQDRLNWSWPTLATVMCAKVPRPDVRAEVRHADPALSEIDLINAGTADYSRPVQITLHWREGRLVAADGLLGFDSTETGANAVQFQSKTGAPRLQAGERRSIGWVRLSQETEVQIEVAQFKN